MTAAQSRGFEILCEIQPPTSPDMGIVREQIAALSRYCDAFLVPDNHLGRASVSSISVAHEVGYLKGRAVACVNARDRNLLGLRRDLLTAAAYGVRDLLFIYGDRPSQGERSGMTVREMLAEVQSSDIPGGGFRVGVAADIGRPFPDWKRSADFVLTQIAFDAAAVSRWREETAPDMRVLAGVMVLSSVKMARRLEDAIPGLRVPADVVARLEADRDAGVDVALEQVAALREEGVVDGVHLIPAVRYQQVAQALAASPWT